MKLKQNGTKNDTTTSLVRAIRKVILFGYCKQITTYCVNGLNFKQCLVFSCSPQATIRTSTPLRWEKHTHLNTFFDLWVHILADHFGLHHFWWSPNLTNRDTLWYLMTWNVCREALSMNRTSFNLHVRIVVSTKRWSLLTERPQDSKHAPFLCSIPFSIGLPRNSVKPHNKCSSRLVPAKLSGKRCVGSVVTFLLLKKGRKAEDVCGRETRWFGPKRSANLDIPVDQFIRCVTFLSWEYFACVRVYAYTRRVEVPWYSPSVGSVFAAEKCLDLACILVPSTSATDRPCSLKTLAWCLRFLACFVFFASKNELFSFYCFVFTSQW